MSKENEQEVSQKLNGIAEKLDAILKLITKLIDPMTKTLTEAEKSGQELRKSIRSRYIVLFGMGLIALFLTGTMYHVLDQMSDLVDELEVLAIQVTSDKVDATMTGVQVETLVSLAEETASTPEIRKKLKSIKRLKDNPSPEQIKMVAHAVARRPSHAVLDKIIWMPVDNVIEFKPIADEPNEKETIEASSDSMSDKK